MIRDAISATALQESATAVRVHYFTPGTANAVWSYDFNAAGQLSAVARDNDAFAWTGHYAVNRGYTTNGLNQYSAASRVTDAIGGYCTGLPASAADQRAGTAAPA